MRPHTWLLVSIITFFCPCINIASIFLEPRSLIPERNWQSPQAIGGGFSFSMENSRQLDFTPKPLSLSESKFTLSDPTVSEPILSESETESTIFSSKSESSTSPRMRVTNSHIDNVTHTITRSRVNPQTNGSRTEQSSIGPSDPRMQLTQSHINDVTHTITRSRVNPQTNGSRTEHIDNRSFTNQSIDSSKKLYSSLTNANAPEDNPKFTSECVCGDGQTYSQRRREKERIRSENSHKHEVFQEMVGRRGNGFRRANNKKEEGLESGANGTKEGNREEKKNGDLDLVGNLSELHRKKKRNEDRIVNGYDVSGLARPWHASLVDTTTQ